MKSTDPAEETRICPSCGQELESELIWEGYDDFGSRDPDQDEYKWYCYDCKVVIDEDGTIKTRRDLEAIRSRDSPDIDLLANYRDSDE